MTAIAQIELRPAATFRGLRHVPLIALSHNSIYPSLHIGEDAVIVRVIRRHRLSFDDIGAVDYRWRLAHQVTIIPKQGPWTFSANFLDRASACKVLIALNSAGVPLAPQAFDFLGREP